MKTCQKKCKLDPATETCEGCGRTLDEIKEAYRIHMRQTQKI